MSGFNERELSPRCCCSRRGEVGDRLPEEAQLVSTIEVEFPWRGLTTVEKVGDAMTRASVLVPLVCAGLGLSTLAACSAPDAHLSPPDPDVVVDPTDARHSLDGVLVSEDNPLRLYTADPGTGQSNRSSPTPPVGSGGDSGRAVRDRAVSELGLSAAVDPEMCEPVRDVAISYLAVPPTSADSYKAVSKDNLTAVTVELADSTDQARQRVAENIELHGHCQNMTMTVSGVSVQTRVTPLNVEVDAVQSSAAMVSGSVLGAPLKAVLAQASVGNAVVTVSHFDSDFLVTGTPGGQRMAAEELERETTEVANAVLHNLRDRAA